MKKETGEVQATSFVFFCTILLVIVFFTSCHQYSKNSTHINVDNTSIEKGQILAAQYCQSCHMLPDPSLLDTKSWEKGVLPNMGPRLGIFEHFFQKYPNSAKDENIGRKYYPSKQLLTNAAWQNILDYYESLSPDSLPAQERGGPIEKSLPLFKAITPSLQAYKYFNPAIGYIKIDTTVKPHYLFLADVNKKNLIRINEDLVPVDSVVLKGVVIDMVKESDVFTFCNIGILYPNDGKHGSCGSLYVSKENAMHLKDSIIFDSLQRPVQIAAADLDADGNKDYLVCEFGNLTGALSWMENDGGGHFKKHILMDLPGALRINIVDHNKDSLPDFYVLFAQGDEQIILFTSRGNGNFEQKQVLRFPPSYGSSYFELADFNNDGYSDILYTCGDNADFTPVLKPYHGVYIFINDGHENFKQQYFFPVNGCYKAMARDFDNDGDMDIASISFFADYTRQPEEGFVYLENKGQFYFKPFSIPETKMGHWLTMDAADFDGDGKIDIVLGNFSATAMEESSVNWQQQPAFLLLKNTGLNIR